MECDWFTCESLAIIRIILKKNKVHLKCWLDFCWAYPMVEHVQCITNKDRLNYTARHGTWALKVFKLFCKNALTQKWSSHKFCWFYLKDRLLVFCSVQTKDNTALADHTEWFQCHFENESDRLYLPSLSSEWNTFLTFTVRKVYSRCFIWNSRRCWFSLPLSISLSHNLQLKTIITVAMKFFFQNYVPGSLCLAHKLEELDHYFRRLAVSIWHETYKIRNCATGFNQFTIARWIISNKWIYLREPSQFGGFPVNKWQHNGPLFA